MTRSFELDVKCPHCGRLIELHSSTTGEPGSAPVSGDRSVCYECGGVGVYEVSPLLTTLRKPTAEEAAEDDADSRLQAALGAWRDNVKGKPRPLRADPYELLGISRRRFKSEGPK